jgi:hypothetical protein
MSYRTPPRLLTILPALGLALLTACSGATDSGLFGPVESDTSPTEPGGSGSAATTPGTTPGRDSSPAPSTPPPSPKEETKPATPTDPPAPAACSQEAEPNDVTQRANSFTNAVCGQIANVADVDFVEVRAPANAQKMKITHTETGAKLAFRLFEDGDVKTSSLPASSTVSVDGGSMYTVRISAAQASLEKATYEVRVTFE